MSGTRNEPSGGRRFRTPLRGHAFAGPIPDEALTVGRTIELVREPENPADPFAVAVWSEDADRRRWRLGYLDRTVAARLAPRMDDGAELAGVIDGWIEEPDGRWERPLVRLEVRIADDEPDQVRATVWGRQPGVRRRRVGPAEG